MASFDTSMLLKLKRTEYLLISWNQSAITRIAIKLETNLNSEKTNIGEIAG
jgi:hypothetical protein